MKDAIKAFEEAKQCVAAEATKVRCPRHMYPARGLPRTHAPHARMLWLFNGRWLDPLR